MPRNNLTNAPLITTLAEFLYSPIELKEFQLLRLAPTDVMTENGCMIMANTGISAWPLICDATWYSIEWIRLFLKNHSLMVVRYHVLNEYPGFLLMNLLAFCSSNCELNWKPRCPKGFTCS